MPTQRGARFKAQAVRPSARTPSEARSATRGTAEGLRATLQRPEVRALPLGAGVVAPHAVEEALAMVVQVRKAVERSTHEGTIRPRDAQPLLVADEPDSAHEVEARTARRRRDALLGLESARVILLLREAVSAIW